MYLERIVATKQQQVKQLKQTVKFGEWERYIADMPPARRFESALRNRNRSTMGLIAEVKKASPSKGLIRADFQPVDIAKAYERAGADCLSVLTDELHFQGSNDDLRQVRETTGLPILRKDFTVDGMQIYEARMIGADAILLIAAILTDCQMRLFMNEARGLGLDVLVEVHDRAEMERVLELDVTMVGINNRNLKTFATDIHTTEQLIGVIPSGVIRVSESGISLPQEITYLSSIGTDAVLIGEHFMRQPKVDQAVNDLLGVAAREGTK